MTLVTSNNSYPPTFSMNTTVVQLDSRSSCHIKFVDNVFSEYIEKIYGNQNDAKEKIFLAVDRTTLLFFESNEPAGLLVYKNQADDEYGLNFPSREIKTFWIAPKFRGKGLGKRFFSTFIKTSTSFPLRVAIRETKLEVIDFFQKFDFVAQDAFTKAHQDRIYALWPKK